ncbi:hypothetical protein NVS55_12975 [Myxococcus stipitatus]|uniref:hypothetical protein n=1 Tax=Myxococcus stipitatus TaxID=83455 RepID=UPI003144F7A3
MRRFGFVVLAAVSLACGQQEGAPSPVATQSQQSTCVPPPGAETKRVYEGLKPHCEGCHVQGNRGYFASLEAFQGLMVADTRMVKAGKPDESELVRLLEGKGTGAFNQMPIGQKSYAQLVTDGTATLTMERIRTWVQELGAQQRGAEPNVDAPRITRKSANQMQRALYQQLGLVHEDFYIVGLEHNIPMAEMRDGDHLPLLSPDALPMPRQKGTEERYHGLGGGSTVRQISEDRTASPTFALTLTQVSQRWCRRALGKAGNTALFPTGTVRTANPVDVKATLRRWSLHFLGERFTDAQVEDLYTKVFVPLSTPTDTEPAYVGVCSYFIRHPRWIFY